MANRVLAAIRRFWNWCLEQGKAETSPVANVKAPAREASRDRILSDEEIAAVWHACDGMGWPFGPLIQLLIVTGQREDEVAGMRWSDIDLDARPLDSAARGEQERPAEPGPPFSPRAADS